MRFVNFLGSNIVLTKPEGWKDEECMDIDALKHVDSAGHPFYMVAVMPSKEDIDAINAGQPVYIKVIGERFQPMSVWTMNEKDEPNF
jgi:hypothetical protein